MRIKIIKDEKPIPPPPPPAYDKAYVSNRNVVIGQKSEEKDEGEDYELPEEPAPIRQETAPREEIRRGRGRPPVNSMPEAPIKPEIPFEIAYFKEHYGDVFGADSLLGKDVIQLNLLFGIFSEVLKLKETIINQ